jgi:hypothetical protein
MKLQEQTLGEARWLRLLEGLTARGVSFQSEVFQSEHPIQMTAAGVKIGDAAEAHDPKRVLKEVPLFGSAWLNAVRKGSGSA